MMATLLCVQANPKNTENSKSLTMAQAFLTAYREAHPEDRIETVDVYRESIPLLDEQVLETWDKLHGEASLTEAEQAKMAAITKYTDQFIEADKYVFVTPLWNLSVPPMMKAYIDCITVVGKTFRYTENGPVGLLRGKRAVHLHARGGIYSRPPMSELEFADRYIKGLLTFLGVTDVQSVICEGHDYAPDKAGEILEAAVSRAEAVAREF